MTGPMFDLGDYVSKFEIVLNEIRDHNRRIAECLDNLCSVYGIPADKLCNHKWDYYDDKHEVSLYRCKKCGALKEWDSP